MIYAVSALLIGFNETNQKGVLLFGAFSGDGIQFLADISKGTYLIGTFGSTLSVIYAYNASNTSGYTKKVGSLVPWVASVVELVASLRSML